MKFQSKFSKKCQIFSHSFLVSRTSYSLVSFNGIIQFLYSLDQKGPSQTLQEASVQIIPTDACNKEHRYNEMITDEMVCAGSFEGFVFELHPKNVL